jgi:hypothetical protein
VGTSRILYANCTRYLWVEARIGARLTVVQDCTWECDQQSTPELEILGECGVAPTLVPGIPTSVCGAKDTFAPRATGSPFGIDVIVTTAPITDPWNNIYQGKAAPLADPFADDPLFGPHPAPLAVPPARAAVPAAPKLGPMAGLTPPAPVVPPPVSQPKPGPAAGLTPPAPRLPSPVSPPKSGPMAGLTPPAPRLPSPVSPPKSGPMAGLTPLASPVVPPPPKSGDPFAGLKNDPMAKHRHDLRKALVKRLPFAMASSVAGDAVGISASGKFPIGSGTR